MHLLISDANILIDIDVAGLLAPMFSMNFIYGIPDILYHEELKDSHAHILDYGLRVISLHSETVANVETLVQKYQRCSRNDLFALALAEQESCLLLTGDESLKKAATKESIEVHGTIWLISQMVQSGKLNIDIAKNASKRMQEAGRRLPWSLLDEALDRVAVGL